MNTSKQQSKEVSVNTGQVFFLLKKTEKLSAATYMVTNLISDTEPLKWRLREKNLVLLSDIISLRTSALSERTEYTAAVSGKIMEIISLIEVASMGGLVSEMNASILKGEYKDLEKQLEAAVMNEGYPRNTLTDLFESVPASYEDPAQANLNLSDNKEEGIKDRNYKGQDTYTSVLYNQHKRQQSRLTSGNGNVGAVQNKKVGSQYKVKSLAESKAIKSGRKDKIISIVRKKGQVTIKDISAVISGCSEKTLQRELLSMVKDNVLKKEGERRWSKYSLK
ncbi:hypothetical protein ACFLY0_00375 [Patescibacteria group bacterium]